MDREHGMLHSMQSFLAMNKNRCQKVTVIVAWMQQTRMAEKIMNEADLEKDVGQNLMQLLGGQAKRRRSSASSLASDESMLSNRYCLGASAVASASQVAKTKK